MLQRMENAGTKRSHRLKIIYGLETMEPTAGVNNMLDSFHLKGLRKILEMKTTFIDRANTNERVYQKAQEVLNTKN